MSRRAKRGESPAQHTVNMIGCPVAPHSASARCAKDLKTEAPEAEALSHLRLRLRFFCLALSPYSNPAAFLSGTA